jgi:predicted nuclease of predicted toxin-antitoxin system
VRLLLDEMLPAVVAQQLRARGHDVSAVVERSELRGLADPELFDHAQTELRALVTYNRDDFLALDRQYRAAGRDHGGVIILNSRRFPRAAKHPGS